MWSQERHNKIIALLNERQRLTTEMFAKELGVSRETIRRDLIELEQSGKLSRVHGGAIPGQVQPEASYVEREQLHRQEKQAIAHAATSLLRPGQSCFMDAGSTTHALARELLSCRDLRVITNSVAVASTLARHDSIEVLLLGGKLSVDLPATYGEFTVAEINRHRVDIALISPVSLDAEVGAMNYIWQEGCVAQAMLARARQRVLLADAKKLGLHSRMKICSCSEVDVLVTDKAADPRHLEALQAAGVRSILRAG